MRYLVFIIALFILFTVDAQKIETIDSLKNEIITLKLDTTTVRVLNKLASEYWYRNPDSTKYFAKKAIEYSVKIKDKKGYIGALRNYGSFYLLTTNYDSAEFYFNKGLEELKAFPDIPLQIATQSALGIIYSRRRNNAKALAMYEKSYKLADSVGQRGRAGIILNNIGGIYFRYNNYPKALEYYIKALESQKLTNDQQAISMCFANMGLVYSSIGDSLKAIQFYDSALQIKKEIGDFGGLANAYYNIGTIYGEGGQEDLPIALDLFRKSFKINKQLGDKMAYAYDHASIGIMLQKLKRLDSSLWYYNKALEIQTEIQDEFGVAITNYNIATLYDDMEDYVQARKYAQKVIDISDSIKYFEMIKDGALIMMEIEEGTGNKAKAYDYAKILISAQDSLYSEEKSREIGRLESQYELDKSLYENQLKESENQLLKKEADTKQQQLELQSIILVAVIVLLLVFVGFAILLRRRSLERQKLLDEIKSQAQKLKDLDQAKTRFFANISHDLRSPLTLILGALDKVSERDYDVLEPDSREMLELGMRNGKRLLYLADEIMDLTRLEEGKMSLKMEYVKIVPYLKLLTKMFSSAADIKSIVLKFEAEADEESTLQLDPHQFEKIIYNLLSNAIKFTPENGRVVVSIRTEYDKIIIEVADSGEGIPEESLGLVFDRYYQSSNSGFTSQTGVGIGLALVKELVELHQGSIEVRSNKEGAVFTISFPFKTHDWVSKAIIPDRSLDVITRNSLWMDLQEEHEKVQIASLTNVSPDAKTILIVEDHKELRFYLKSILSPNFKIFLAENGEKGLMLLQAEKIDLIITDLMMPYMDGFEFIDQLKKDKELKKIPVLVVSARTDQDEKVGLIKKGADAVISKPFDKEELYARISNILGREWDSKIKLTKLYEESAEEFEKSIMGKMERLIISRVSDPHLSVLDLADEMAASERKVYRMIKKLSGLTPYELIKEVRWQYLEGYLKNNKLKTAKEAALLVAMNNTTLFSKQYEKRFGKSIKQVLVEE
ncbi:MAG: tetratricopeptide repeat protein [Cyclobacteriaceae bacterium]